MAGNQEDRPREELTEEASPFRIEEYRRRGMVAQSRELSGLIGLVGAGFAVYALSPAMGAQIAEFMREVFRVDLSSRLDLGATHGVESILMKAVRIMVSMALPICLIGFIAGALGSFAQIGAIFSWDPIMPDFSKINPLTSIRRMFSLKQALDGIKLVFKVICTLWVAYWIIRMELLHSPEHFMTEVAAILPVYSHSARQMLFSLMTVLAVFACIDYVLQRWEYTKNVRMTKQEAKQEHREREGDPQIKARIRSVQREIARRRMMQAVKKADVVITNPTHIAVALVYDKKAMVAPKVVAKGADLLAQKIKEIASTAGIPLVENVPLARTLYKSVKIGQHIPRALYQAVAEVLAYVYKLKKEF